MEAINERELNKKLAEWVGWKIYQILPTGFVRWMTPQGKVDGSKPDNFSQSLDALFEHIVPKYIDKIMAEQKCSSDVAYSILFKKWLQELELNMTRPALTLCLAISKIVRQGG